MLFAISKFVCIRLIEKKFALKETTTEHVGLVPKVPKASRPARITVRVQTVHVFNDQQRILI